MLNNIGFDASISFLPSLELYLDSNLYGLRWQFLNHGPTTENDDSGDHDYFSVGMTTVGFAW